MASPQAITIPRPKPAEPAHGEVLCHVCGKPVDQRMDGACRNCDKPIHIPWRQDRPQPECSRIAPLPNSCGVSWLCMPCHEKLGL